MTESLLSLSQGIRELDDLLTSVEDPESPEVQEAIAKLLDLSKDRDVKIDNYCQFIRELELRAEARKEESKRLAVRAEVNANVAKRLKASLQLALQTMEIKKVETTRFTVTRANNGGKLPLDLDEGLVPDEYKETVETVKIDKQKIRDALDEGKVLPFAQYGKRGENLRIK